MKTKNIKAFLDACYEAKRIRELLPVLPEGVTPSYIHYLDKIQELEKQGISVKVSDISQSFQIPRPGVTRTVKEMEKKGYLKKVSSKEDGRITYISLTEKGKRLSLEYDELFFKKLSPVLADISDEEAECTIRTIGKIYEIMSERRISIHE